jgi:HSP20 family protein
MASREVEEWLWINGRGLERLADRVATSRTQIAGSRYWEPRADVFEEAHRLLIKVELPGVRTEDIQLAFIPSRRAIVIHGVRAGDFDEGDRIGIHQIEIMYGEFHREIELPCSYVDTHGIRAHCRNGFLMIMVPKVNDATLTLNPD